MVKKCVVIFFVTLLQLVCFPAQAVQPYDSWMGYVEKFKRAFVKCGKSYFVYLGRDGFTKQSDLEKFDEHGVWVIPKWGIKFKNQWDSDLKHSLTELQDVSFVSKPKLYETKATKADALNGLADHEGQVWHDWKVTIKVGYKAIRYQSYNGWGEWGDANQKYSNKEITIQKYKDTVEYLVYDGWWTSPVAIDESTEFIQPSCDGIPQTVEKEFKRQQEEQEKAQREEAAARDKRCSVERELIYKKAVERVKKEFQPIYGEYVIPIYEKSQLNFYAFDNCYNRKKQIEINDLLAAYDQPFPSLVPEQWWVPNKNYCGIISKRMDAYIDANFDSLPPEGKGSASDIMHKKGEIIPACSEKLTTVIREWYSLHPTTQSIIDLNGK